MVLIHINTKKTLKKISSFNNDNQVRLVVSRSHLDPESENFIKKNKDFSIIRAGSSLKFCLISEGRADFILEMVKPWDGT